MTDTVTDEVETAQDVVEEVMPEETSEEVQEETEEQQEQKKEEVVPVAAVVAERKKRQEAEQRSQWLEQQMLQSQQAQQPQQPAVDNNDLVTVGNLNENFASWKRQILEEAYMQANPDIIDRIKTELPEILQDPKNKWLADSITTAENRLERSAQILGMFTSKKAERAQAPPPNRNNTPKSPQAVSKTNKLSIADRIMTMSDQELEEWRISQKRKVR